MERTHTYTVFPLIVLVQHTCPQQVILLELPWSCPEPPPPPVQRKSGDSREQDEA